MINVTETLALITSKALLLEPERVPLEAARGRVLREDILADMDSPRFDCSAMDGYAIRNCDAGQPLRLVGEIPAGHDPELKIGAGECARIFTGGRVPLGADAVVMQEEARAEGEYIHVHLDRGATHIRRQGENYRKGDALLRTGMRLGPAALATLANCGMLSPLVTRLPRILHVVTGNELIPPDAAPEGTQVRDCNSTLVSSLLAERGIPLLRQLRVGDSLDAAADALASQQYRRAANLRRRERG